MAMHIRIKRCTHQKMTLEKQVSLIIHTPKKGYFLMADLKTI